ncbi:MAG: AAA family ATPase [Anaerolineales bacterium]|nr:AAA family ATPase [Chloroflexota bacterium]MBL6982668.1 AAA family ATPase [Anaerolineales bacterium]
MGIVIGVFSAKGGVGKSLVATNLGAVFAAGHHFPTALIDLNAGLGASDLLLDLEPERCWSDLLPVTAELAPQHLNLATTQHDSGLHLLACPEFPDAQANLTRESLAALCTAFRQEYALTLLDVPTGMGVINVAAFHLVDMRLILLTPDAPALRATQRYANSLSKNEKPVGLVLNQYGRGAPVSPKEIESHLGGRLYATLPVDQSAVWANVSYGQPCALKQRRGLGRALRGLSKTVLKVAKRSEYWDHNGQLSD